MSIPFVDLKAQYKALQRQPWGRADRVLADGQYVMGSDLSAQDQNKIVKALLL